MTDPASAEPPGRFQGLTAVERFNVRAVERWHAVPPLGRLSVWLGYHVSRPLIKAVLANLVRAHHFDRLRDVPPEHGILLCGNHRSYLDPFAISAFAMEQLPPDLRFAVPSRTEHLYDRWWSLVANLGLTFGNIYPPVVRGSRGGAWGKQVIEILTALLQRGRVVVPIHPEGGRNKGPDPYVLLSGRPGLGKIIHQTRATVFPIYLNGFPRGPVAVLRENYRRGAKDHPHVHMVMGPPVDFSAERAEPGSPSLYYAISQKLIAAIAALMDEEKALKAATRRG